jgi:type II secretory pathway pseudopilin PulG
MSRIVVKRFSSVARSANSETAGFTIIELLIATLVFSSILILITMGVISFNKAYYQGIVQTSTQNVARKVIEDISQAIQFNSSEFSVLTPDPDGSQGYCIGGQRYSYLIGYQLVNGSPVGQQANHALVRDTPCDSSGSAQPLKSLGTLPAGSTELLGQHMRLASLGVASQGADTFTVQVRVVYGDDDLLCSPSVSGSCDSAATMPSPDDFQKGDLQCKPQVGSQFCAVSELATTVEQRINQ